MTVWPFFLTFVAALLFAGPARAHPMDPGLLRVREITPGLFGVLWKPPANASRATKLEPILPRACRKAKESGGDAGSDVRVVDCGVRGLWGERVSVEGVWGIDDEVLVQVTPLEGESALGVLHATSRSFVLPESPSARFATGSFVRLGIAHILTGWDHLLFVVGLILLTGFTSRLIATITAFTAAHSVTLALSVLNVIRLPVPVVEALIALSVLLLAADVSRTDSETDVFGRRRPWALAFGFGLLHGLGFAEVLRSMKIPSGDLPRALLSFNVGVELGQLGVVAALGALYWVLARFQLRSQAVGRRFVVEGMGILAAFWFFQRIAAFWS